MKDFDKFYEKALKFLSYRPRSEKEIRENLAKKKAASSLIDLVIKKLQQQRFLNDREFAKWWVEQRTIVKPMGKRLIKMELTKKGIDKELIDEIFDDIEDIINNELEMVRKLVQRKFNKYKNTDKQIIYRRLGGFLSRRGFDYDTIKKVIDETF